MSDGFLGRWSRRKLEQEKAPDVNDKAYGEADAAAKTTTDASAPAKPVVGRTTAEAGKPPKVIPAAGPSANPEPSVDLAAEPAPPPTLEDAQKLSSASDFQPFMARGVTPDVRNAAMKKLFADPRYNVMDGLDTYIDDYSKPDPLPAAMLRQMVSARYLGLVQDEPESTADGQTGAARVPAGEDTDSTTAPGVAESASGEQPPSSSGSATPSDSETAALPDQPTDPLTTDATAAPTEHAHTDLRLQPDHAARRESVGQGDS